MEIFLFVFLVICGAFGLWLAIGLRDYRRLEKRRLQRILKKPESQAIAAGEALNLDERQPGAPTIDFDPKKYQ